jgi:citrate synthase
MQDCLLYLSWVSALWGPLHGGANQAVLEMLQKNLIQQVVMQEQYG